MTIALLTDFGLKDAYVGLLKGVIAGIAPEAPVVDLAHDIAPYDRIHAGLLLYQAFRYFPKKTIFLAVVDPGVGSRRKAILVQTQNYFFIGPDNGIFSMVLAEEQPKKIIHLNNEKYFLQPVSATFHGRDIFAPVAAHLATGIDPEAFGEPIGDYVNLPDFFPEIVGQQITGRVLSIDRYGNAITNLSHGILSGYLESHIGWATLGESNELPLPDTTHYAANQSGSPFLLFNSSALLEVAVNQGSAADTLRIKAGDPIRISLKEKT